MNNYVSKIENNRWKIGISTTIDLLRSQLIFHINTHIQEPKTEA